MKISYKQILAFFLMGFLISIIGASFKILHKQGAETIIIIGMFVESIALILAIIKLMAKK